jgi:hemin uptake protein HemP
MPPRGGDRSTRLTPMFHALSRPRRFSPMVSDERPPPSGGADSPDAVRGEAENSARQVRPAIINSADLLQGRREIWIEHGSEMYRLRLTSSGKLYLTK